MISIRHKGNFRKFESYLKRLRNKIKYMRFDKYGQAGVDALKSATPIDSGLTADSWYYEITQTDTLVVIEFKNSNIENESFPVAIMLQYGHGTKNGGWVQGTDYINPALRPVFESIAKDAWEEVLSL